MLQVSIAIGKSSGADVSFNSVPFATALATGRMAIIVGEAISPAMSSGEVIKRAYEAIGAVASAFKKNGVEDASLLKAEFTNPRNVSTMTLSASAAGASDATIGAIVNNTNETADPDITITESRTLLIEAGLEQCYEVLREAINAHQSSIVA